MGVLRNSIKMENWDSFDYKIPLAHFMFLEFQEWYVNDRFL